MGRRSSAPAPPTERPRSPAPTPPGPHTDLFAAPQGKPALGAALRLPMDAAEFTAVVERVAGLQGSEAERAVRAALTTLAERLSPAEARDLTEALPPELGPWLFTTDPAEEFDVDEFLRRVAGRAEVGLTTPERVARAVFLALTQALSRDEFADVQAQLAKDFAMLLPRGPPVEVLPLEELLDRSRTAPGATATAPAGPAPPRPAQTPPPPRVPRPPAGAPPRRRP